MSDRARHIVERQTTQAMTMLGRTVRDMLDAGLDPAMVLAKVQRACREGRAEIDAVVPSGRAS